MSDQLKDKDAAFLKAIIENGGEATTAEIREYTKEDAAVPELDNSHINYRCSRLGHKGTSTVSGKGLVKVEKGGLTEDGTPAPKVACIDDDRVYDLVEAWEDEASATVGNFASVEEAFTHLLEDVEELKAESNEQTETVEQLTTEFRAALGEIREVVRDEHGVDIKDAVEDASQR